MFESRRRFFRAVFPLMLAAAAFALPGCTFPNIPGISTGATGSSGSSTGGTPAQSTAGQTAGVPLPAKADRAALGESSGPAPAVAGLGKADSSTGNPTAPEAKAAGRVFRVIATAEGLIGGRTATGAIIKKWSEGAALPSRKALGRKLKVTYLKNGAAAGCPVGDVGPWNTRDAYWEKSGGRPQAESGRDTRGRRTNRAGLDLYNATWYRLLRLRSYDKRIIENTTGKVDWQFGG